MHFAFTLFLCFTRTLLIRCFPLHAMSSPEGEYVRSRRAAPQVRGGFEAELQVDAGTESSLHTMPASREDFVVPEVDASFSVHTAGQSGSQSKKDKKKDKKKARKEKTRKDDAGRKASRTPDVDTLHESRTEGQKRRRKHADAHGQTVELSGSDADLPADPPKRPATAAPDMRADGQDLTLREQHPLAMFCVTCGCVKISGSSHVSKARKKAKGRPNFRPHLLRDCAEAELRAYLEERETTLVELEQRQPQRGPLKFRVGLRPSRARNLLERHLALAATVRSRAALLFLTSSRSSVIRRSRSVHWIG